MYVIELAMLDTCYHSNVSQKVSYLGVLVMALLRKGGSNRDNAGELYSKVCM